MYLAGIITVVILAAAFWFRRLQPGMASPRQSISIALMSLLLVTLSSLAYVERMDRDTVEDDVPVIIAIAVDLSLSMGTKPDPRSYGDVGTRLQRAQKILLPVLNALDASGARVMISVTGFTGASETILGWDDNLPQIREALEYVIAPGILTQPGSDLGVALQGVIPNFENLSEEFLTGDGRKYLIVVSDGEQTLERGDAAAALADLRAKGVDILALQMGLQDVPEGFPVYDEAGSFMGFQDIGGQIFSVSSPETMAMIAGDDPDRGIVVSAESRNAIAQVSDFIGVKMSSTTTASPIYTSSILVLLGLGLAIMLWFV
jgi:hypothetical protein